MNVWTLLGRLPQVLKAVQDLASRILVLHEDPGFKALIASDPAVKAQSDAISLDARQIQDAFK